MIIRKKAYIPPLPKKKRVAAYARVSSGKDAMLHSLSAQISYYSAYIQKHSDWLYCGVYVDEAVTGTKAERVNFQRLLRDCRSGKIDLIITKSISRFARNTVTLLETVRELKSLGVDVFFEESNMHTLSAPGEMMLTLLASIAEEEARNTSERMRWRVRTNYQNGEPWNGTVYGYRVLSSKLICGDCGDFFGPKVWHSTDKYRKEIWQCGHKFKGGKICDTPHLTVEQIQALFMDAYNRLMREDPAQLIADCALMLAQLLDTSDLNREITAADEKMAVTSVQIAALVNENAVTVQAQDLYNEKYAALEKRYKREQAEKERLEKQIESRKGRAKELEAYIAAMQENGTYITEWDDTLWLRMVSKAIVHTDGSVTFVFKDGNEIQTKL